MGRPLLCPPPRAVLEIGSGPRLSGGFRALFADPAGIHRGAARLLEAALEEAGVRLEIVSSGPADGVFGVAPKRGSEGAQSYELVLDRDDVRLSAADPAGLFYGVTTFVQILEERHEDGSLPGLRISDGPSFPNRGVLLDVSRDRVPTMETLFALVERLASWKINQLQLYTEHAFAYPGHEIVWRNADPLTPEEIRRLDAFCRERHVELVPNQQSFGHMHRWLVHEPYRRLAEVPEGIAHPFSLRREPYGLCPTDPLTLDFLGGLYDRLLPNFTSAQLNVGLDETLDLGLGRSAELCKREGKGRVYVEFLKAVRGLASQRGRRIQFWADMALRYPEVLAQTPGDAVALVWGYEADHPFAAAADLFRREGLAFYVCPGTSSWNSFGGRTANAIENIRSAARAGAAAGAEGLLIADWGDNGHLQPLPVSYAGLLAGAACAWNAGGEGAGVEDLPSHLDRRAFRDRAGLMGRIACDLGDVHASIGARAVNGTALFYLLTRPDLAGAHEKLAGVTRAGLRQARNRIEDAAGRMASVRMEKAADGPLILEEYRWVAAALDLACRLGWERCRGGSLADPSAIPEAARKPLAADLERLIAGHRQTWLRRSRPGGLADSCLHLATTLARL